MKKNPMYVKGAHMNVAFQIADVRTVMEMIADKNDADNLTVHDVSSDGGTFRCGRAAVHVSESTLYETIVEVISEILSSDSDTEFQLEEGFNVEYDESAVDVSYIKSITDISCNGKLLTVEFDTHN